MSVAVIPCAPLGNCVPPPSVVPVASSVVPVASSVVPVASSVLVVEISFYYNLMHGIYISEEKNV